MIKLITKNLACLVMLLSLSAFPGLASAAKALIVCPCEDGRDALTLYLEQASYKVDVSQGITKVDLKQYNQVWDMRLQRIIPLQEYSGYINYLSSGGSLVLVGDHVGYRIKNNSIRDFVIAAGGGTLNPVVDDSIEVQEVISPLQGPFPIAGGLTSVKMIWASIFTTAANGKFVAKYDQTSGSTILWDRGTLTNAPQGTLVVWGDANGAISFADGWFPIENEYFTRNLIHYMGEVSEITDTSVPGPLAYVAAAADDGTATVSWLPPQSTGNPAFSGYRVEYALSNAGPWLKAPGSCGNTETSKAISCTAAPLGNDIPYWFRVAAINTVGTGEFKVTESSVTPSPKINIPEAPAALGATAGDAKVTLNWTVPANNGGAAVSGYFVEIGPSAAGPWDTAQGTCDPDVTTASAALTCEATGLGNGTTYHFRVAAINSAGQGPFTNPESAMPVSKPLPPEEVFASPRDTKAEVRWYPPLSDGGSPLISYKVEVATDPDPVTGNWAPATGCTLVAANTDPLECVATGLTNGGSYYFRVIATNAEGDSEASFPSEAVTPIATIVVPDAPASVGAEAGNQKAVVSWTEPESDGGADVTGYQVQFGQSPTGPWSNATGGCAPGVTNTSTALECEITGLTNGQTYYFQVAAINSAGTGAFSLSNPVIPATLPDAPMILSGTGALDSVNLTWQSPSDDGGNPLTGYRVEYSTSDMGPWKDPLGSCDPGTTNFTTATQCEADLLTPGTTYYFRVAAVTNMGVGPYSVPLLVRTQSPPPTAPGPVPYVTAAATSNSATVSWFAPESDGGSALTGYQVEYAQSETGPWIPAPGACASATGSTGTSCVASPLSNGNAYFFRVAAINGVGPGSPTVSEVSVTPTPGVTPPGAPTGLSAVAGDAKATLNWNPPGSMGGSAVTGYFVEVGLSATGPWQPAQGSCDPSLTTLFANLTCDATDLANGTTQFFRVAAINSAGQGPFSSPASTLPVTKPLPPEEVFASPRPSGAEVRWNPPLSDGGSAITNYRVQVSTSPTGPWADAAGGCAPLRPAAPLECDAGSLTNGTTYYFRVIAINAQGSSEPSPPSDGVIPTATVVVPSAPQDVVAEAENGKALVSWMEPESDGGSDVTGYRVQVSQSAGGPWTNAAGGCAATAASTALQCEATGLTNGQTYYFQVAAINSQGTGEYSSPSNAVLPATLPGAPSGLGGTGSLNGVSLRWQAPSNTGGSSVIGYQVQIGTSPTGPWNDAPGGCAAGVTNFSPATQCQANSLSPNTTYYFRVAAITSAGEGPYTAPVAVKTQGNVPNPIPTLSEWAQLLMAMLMVASVGGYRWRTLRK